MLFSFRGICRKDRESDQFSNRSASIKENLLKLISFSATSFHFRLDASDSLLTALELIYAPAHKLRDRSSKGQCIVVVDSRDQQIFGHGRRKLRKFQTSSVSAISKDQAFRFLVIEIGVAITEHTVYS